MSAPLVESISYSDALIGFPAEIEVNPDEVHESSLSTKRCLIVIDDDPTGSQAVSGIPVVTNWQVEDFDWALTQGHSAIFVLLNTRAEDESTARRLNTEAVTNALISAGKLGIDVSFVSRGDSTLRGHFPAETDAITAALAKAGQPQNHATLLIPAFPGAGRVTINGVHYLKTGEELTPVGLTEFAKDASFGYHNSNLAEYVEEKTHGSVSAQSVFNLDLHLIRSSPDQIASTLLALPKGAIASVDAVTVNDLRMLALGLAIAAKSGASFLYRTGPTFVAAWVGQRDYEPISALELKSTQQQALMGGLIVIGSHTALTNAQLDQVRADFAGIEEVELTPVIAMSANFNSVEANQVASSLLETLKTRNVILRTSRKLITGSTAEESLAISRQVSNAIAEVVNRVLKKQPLKFVIAKGGITSNDVASKGLEVRHAIVVGPLLPGLVSLWRPVDGVAVGMPFVVFPGNVGDQFALAQIVSKLSNPDREQKSS